MYRPSGIVLRDCRGPSLAERRRAPAKPKAAKPATVQMKIDIGAIRKGRPCNRDELFGKLAGEARQRGLTPDELASRVLTGVVARLSIQGALNMWTDYEVDDRNERVVLSGAGRRKRHEEKRKAREKERESNGEGA